MIEFGEDCYTEMLEHAKNGVPHEICGVLGGGKAGDDSRVEAVYPVENVSDTPRVNYFMEPEDQLETIDRVEGDGHEVVGFYHSHPEGPDVPSETDADRANWPNHSYVIVSLGGDQPHVGSWRWTGEEFNDEEVDVRS